MIRRVLVALALVALCVHAVLAPVQASTPFQPMMTKSAVTSPAIYWAGGIGVFLASGTFGGATVALSFISPDGTVLAAGTNTTFTAAGAGVFYLPACTIEAVVSGGSGVLVSAAVGSVQP